MVAITLDPTEFWKPALVVLLCFVVAQGSKIVINLIHHKRIRWIENGGMPSSHAATVVGMAMTILIEQGLSLLFLAVAVLAIVVLDDAFGVRWETSRHSLFLNKLINKKTYKIVGHRPLEVFVGGLIGILLPLILYSFL